MRGFAQTVHCPRCGTTKPTGAELVPLVTCTRCGLGFDPKPREPVPRRELVVASAPSVVKVVETADDAHLVIRDSIASGMVLTAIGAGLGWLLAYVIELALWQYVPFLAILGAFALYHGASRLLGRTVIYVGRDVIAAWQRPLPRRRERLAGGAIAELAIRPANAPGLGRVFELVAKDPAGDAVHLTTIDTADATNELVDAIHEQRARLGAPIGARHARNDERREPDD